MKQAVNMKRGISLPPSKGTSSEVIDPRPGPRKVAPPTLWAAPPLEVLSELEDPCEWAGDDGDVGSSWPRLPLPSIGQGDVLAIQV